MFDQFLYFHYYGHQCVCVLTMSRKLEKFTVDLSRQMALSGKIVLQIANLLTLRS